MNELLELFILFFKLGAFTIGGGVAMLPLLKHSLTEEKKWFDQDEFMDVVAVCQSLPGVIAINMATYVGYKRKGLIGSIVSTLGVVIPSFVMILVIAKFISSAGDNAVLNGAMAGFRAAALGLILVAVIQLAPTVFKNKWSVLAAALAFVLIGVLNVNTAYVILLFVVLGISSAIIGSRRAAALQGEALSSGIERDDPGETASSGSGGAGEADTDDARGKGGGAK